MKVLITGAYGFLGKNTALEFKNNGHEVFGIGHGKWYKEEYSKWGIEHWYETTITFEALLNVKEKFDLIIHCGGSGSVGFSHENPYEDFQKSVQSTLALLEFIRLQNPECKFIYPSSPAVQGNLGYIQLNEEYSSIPVSPYGFHKKIAEDLCLSYHNNYDINVGIIRFFSIYGEGLKKQLIWDACNKIKNFDKISFFGTGNETRDWIHISDAVSLIHYFSKTNFEFNIINGGSGITTPISEIIQLLVQIFNKKVEYTFNGLIKEGDPLYYWADISKACNLGWKPKISLNSGLINYVAFFMSLNKN